jgi:hypothetical protein
VWAWLLAVGGGGGLTPETEREQGRPAVLLGAQGQPGAHGLSPGHEHLKVSETWAMVTRIRVRLHRTGSETVTYKCQAGGPPATMAGSCLHQGSEAPSLSSAFLL